MLLTRETELNKTSSEFFDLFVSGGPGDPSVRAGPFSVSEQLPSGREEVLIADKSNI